MSQIERRKYQPAHPRTFNASANGSTSSGVALAQFAPRHTRRGHETRSGVPEHRKSLDKHRQFFDVLQIIHLARITSKRSSASLPRSASKQMLA